VRLIDSAGRRRVIAARTIPASGGTLRATIPRRLRPGRYRLAVTLVGDGLTDSLERALRIRPATVTARVRVRLTAAGWALLVRPSAATRLTGRLEASSAGGGYARLRALAARRLAKAREAAIALGDLEPGRYRAVVRLGGGPPVTRAFRVTA
jgi:hypothetical protein